MLYVKYGKNWLHGEEKRHACTISSPKSLTNSGELIIKIIIIIIIIIIIFIIIIIIIITIIIIIICTALFVIQYVNLYQKPG